MILFIFEGGRREPALYKTMKYLFLSNFLQNDIIVSYCNNIYSLYQKMRELDVFGGAADIVSVLKQLTSNQNQNDELSKIKIRDEISEIYLFFDYDLKKQDNFNRLSVKEQNDQIRELLAYFNNETDKGKLFIDYPMVESIRYFKNRLPDEDYFNYLTDIHVGKKFKEEVNKVSAYKNLRFISFDLDKKNEIKLPKNSNNEIDEEKINEIKSNWIHVKDLNIKKANYICSQINEIPIKKQEISQINIFSNQLKRYVKKEKVAILNSFPLFLYEYLPLNK